MRKTKIEDKNKRKEKNENIARAVKTRGKTFEGTVIKKFPKRVVIEFERSVYVRKYERYFKSRTRIHARVPENLENEIGVGDYIKVQECRPLSKIIHFIVIEKIKSGKSPFFLLAERKSSGKESKLIAGKESKLIADKESKLIAGKESNLIVGEMEKLNSFFEKEKNSDKDKTQEREK